MRIIDNSLCNIDFAENAVSKNVKEYVATLFQCGIDYIEVDGKAMSYLPDVNTSDNFIFRLEKIEDFGILTKKRFRYIVLPLSMIAISKKLSALKIMLEVDCSRYSYDELYEIRNKALAAGCASLRLVSDFKEKDEDLIARCTQWDCTPDCMPINICPLNTSLNGVNAAYTAADNNASMLTLGFGSPYLYTPYERFLLYRSWSFEHFLNMQKLPLLYAATVFLNMISDSHNYAIDNLNCILSEKSKIVGIADSGEMKGNISRPFAFNKKSERFTKAHINFFNRNDLFIRDFCEQLADAVDNADMSLYDRFNESDDFEQ